MDDHTASDFKLLTGHCGPVYAVSFSPDRTSLISASQDGTGQCLPAGWLFDVWFVLTTSNFLAHRWLFDVWFVHCGCLLQTF